MDKTYSPHAIEQAIYQQWEANGWFAPRGEGTPYCIMIPPPNVTGTLHMGHAFQHSLMDALIRLRRMDGDATLWQPGTDHAGIATQMVVERQLNAEGKNRRDLGRDAFVERVWAWKEHSGGTISRQERRLGNSVDWSRDVFTMDPGLSAAVTEVFVRLHEEGLIYRGKRLVNWDPALHTALSDLEVLSEPEAGSLWHFRYPLVDGSGFLTVATTRPETMLGDTAVAVHPEDERYRHLIGKEVRLPLTERLIPIIADTYVDPAFGSGCVKITPGHDFNDYDIGKRHQLPLINILDANACLNAEVPPPYRGLDRFEARKRVVADLDALGLLEKVEAHTVPIPRGDRSGVVLEPWLTDQWYVRTAPLAAPAIEAVESGHIRFVPEHWSKTYYQWMNNIQDWCISRQLWWGHRVPAWYDEQGNAYVARTAAEAQAKARAQRGSDVELHQDEDVLDTWFSSALWPFSTLGWPAQTAELEKFYPTNVLVTGFDIIFFWVARMIMMGLKFTGAVPFREVYITGLILDEEGQKMSKAKGNIIDPIDIIDGIELEALVQKRITGLMQPQMAKRIEAKTRARYPKGFAPFGTDALRFTMAAMATQGREIRFDMGRVEGYRNFCNKLWNAARYVLMNIEGHDCSPVADADLSVCDRWIRSRLAGLIVATRKHFAEYRFDLAAQGLYEFFWYDYCDWYLELTKPVLQSDSTAVLAKRGARNTLLGVLEAYLRLLHPLMPFITEKIWQSVAPPLGKSGPTLMLEPYPQGSDYTSDAAAERAIGPIKALILAPRQIRGQLDVPQSREIPIYVAPAAPHDWDAIEANAALIKAVAKVSEIVRIAADSALPPTAMQLVDGHAVHAPLAKLIDDIDAECERLRKLKQKKLQELGKLEAKLADEKFVNNAPAEVVATQRERVSDLTRDLSQVDEQMARVTALKTA